jgi:16S rRNA (cytosine1402-N4)-methyltransferase
MSQHLQLSAGAVLGHVPVLLDAVLAAMKPVAGEVYADLTFGAGGYSRAFMNEALCNVIGFDRDPDAIRGGQDLVREADGRLRLIEAAFGDFADELDGVALDGVVMDIGVSSMQLDQATRGFSFMKDGPLDMRMSQTGKSAADVVAHYSAEKLADLIYVFGEEPKSRAIGRAIVKARTEEPIATTRQLVAAIERATGPHRPHLRTHPATKTFQALRIYVNDELGQLADALLSAERVLKPGGRLVVVAFHSLEDRIVKQFFAERCGNLPSMSRHTPGPIAHNAPSFRLVNKGHIGASDVELAMNPRSRSAKLRAALRTETASWSSDSKFVKTVAAMRAH